jgi:hypothetical protein
LLQIVLAVYLLAVLALYTSQRGMLFYPQSLLQTPDAPEVRINVSGVSLRGWVVNPGRSCAIIYFGGNGESVEFDVPVFKGVVLGCSVYLIPYRGYSGNPGEPSEAALDSDALSIYDNLKLKHGTVDVMGRSLGTGIATYLAAHRPVSKLLLVTPYDSIVNIGQRQYPIFPVRLLAKDPFESWRSAEKIHSETMIFIAEADQVIPRRNTDNLQRHFRIPIAVKVFAGAGHNSISESPQYWPAVASFFGQQTRDRAYSPSQPGLGEKRLP